MADSLGHSVREIVETNQELRSRVERLNGTVETLLAKNAELRTWGRNSTNGGINGAARPGRAAAAEATATATADSDAEYGERHRRHRQELEDEEDEDDDDEGRNRKRRKACDDDDDEEDAPSERLADGKAKIEVLESLVQSLRERNQTLAADNERLRRDREKARNDCGSLEHELATMRDEKQDLLDDKEALRQKVRSLKRGDASSVRESDDYRLDRTRSGRGHEWKLAGDCRRYEVGTSSDDERDSGQEESDDSSYRNGRKGSSRRGIGTVRPGGRVKHGVAQSYRVPDGSPSVSRHRAEGATRAGGRDGAGGVDRRAVAQTYLDEPVTDAIDEIMQKGVEAFLAFQAGKPHHKYPPGERVYYVCQACSTCRANPMKASYASFRAKDYPNHPTHCDGFAAYHVPLPGQPRIDLQRHLRERRKDPNVIVADPPAATAGRRAKRDH
jgi:hypothetical protein